MPKRTTGIVLFCCWLAILAEGYDVGVLGAVLPALAEYKAWDLTPLQLGGLGAYALVGMLIGALFIGTLSDIVGRKKMLLASMVIFTLTQAGAALATTPEMFGLFRLIGGLGMGGVIPVAAALTIEYSAPKKRSRATVNPTAGTSLGSRMARPINVGSGPENAASPSTRRSGTSLPGSLISIGHPPRSAAGSGAAGPNAALGMSAPRPSTRPFTAA
nr:MFS transporter [Pseudarthrobacter psychrotolerans]